MQQELVLFGRKLCDSSWVSIALSDTAHVNVSLDLEVALVSPVGTPGVLDEPVVNTILSSESNSKDCMVDIRRSILADVRGINSRSVVSESINNLESNGNGSDLKDGMEKLSLISLGDVDGSTLDVKSEG